MRPALSLSLSCIKTFQLFLFFSKMPFPRLIGFSICVVPGRAFKRPIRRETAPQENYLGAIKTREIIKRDFIDARPSGGFLFYFRAVRQYKSWGGLREEEDREKGLFLFCFTFISRFISRGMYKGKSRFHQSSARVKQVKLYYSNPLH